MWKSLPLKGGGGIRRCEDQVLSQFPTHPAHLPIAVIKLILLLVWNLTHYCCIMCCHFRGSPRRQRRNLRYFLLLHPLLISQSDSHQYLLFTRQKNKLLLLEKGSMFNGLEAEARNEMDYSVFTGRDRKLCFKAITASHTCSLTEWTGCFCQGEFCGTFHHLRKNA